MIWPIKLLIDQADPATKKTKGQIAMVHGRPRMFPSKSYRKWVKEARVSVLEPAHHPPIPIAHGVHVVATFYRAREYGDLLGYMQALADFLELCMDCRNTPKRCTCPGGAQAVLANDKFILSWDGTRMFKDASDPRVKVVINRFGGND